MLTDEKKLRREVTKEIRQDIDTYGDERRTLIEEAKGASIAKQVIDEPVTVIVSEKGFLRSRQGHGFDARAMNFKLGDKYRCSMECRSVDQFVYLVEHRTHLQYSGFFSAECQRRGDSCERDRPIPGRRCSL